MLSAIHITFQQLHLHIETGSTVDQKYLFFLGWIGATQLSRNMMWKGAKYILIWGFAEMSFSSLWLSPVIPSEIDRIITYRSQCWSFLCQIHGNIAWNFLWVSAWWYSSLFSPYPHTKSAPSKSVGVCMLLQNRRFTWYTKAPNAVATTDFNCCCPQCSGLDYSME